MEEKEMLNILSELLKEEKKQTELLEKLNGIFEKYDQEYLIEIEQNRDIKQG